MTKFIPIERLTTGTLIALPTYDGVEVYEIKFDGYGYAVWFCMDNRGGWDALDMHYVPVGSCVEYAGLGEPMLRDPDLAELEALAEARAEAARTPVTLDTVAALVCADIAASYAGSIRGDDDPVRMAAE